VLKSDIEIGPAYHRRPKRIRSHALVYSMALILYRVMRSCRVPCDHVPVRSWPLFKARQLMRGVIASLQGEKTS
jgi:hypothetical protein